VATLEALSAAPARVRADGEAGRALPRGERTLIAAMGEALDDATEYGNARRGYAACALTDVLHAQFELARARFKAGELDYANEVEDVLRKMPEQRRQISELEDG
jgi:hypothetical protein